MLNIRLFRENPGIIRESEKKRFKDTKAVDRVIEYDNKWRDVLKKVEDLKHRRNVVSRQIAELKKSRKPTKKRIQQMGRINKQIGESDKKADEYLSRRDLLRYKIGNILHGSVNKGNTEVENKFIRAWGKPLVLVKDMEAFRRDTRGTLDFRTPGFRPKGHVDLLEKLDLADTAKASELSGARFYYLKNELVSLNIAIIKFALDFLANQGFVPMWTPFMLQKPAMAGAAELSDFESQLYKIDKEDLFLIATAEQTLAAYHMGETLKEGDLPRKYVGFSTNFRREAGSHGKDTKGIFRVHQFDKVEQFVFCRPEDSEEWFHKLIRNAETLYQKLSLPYRVMSICSGEMNDNASLKYDIELWMPSQGRFREVVSCSNCTDYQPRKLGIKVERKGGKREVLHTINSTALATQRTMVAILENYQKKDGSVRIPKVLSKYAGFKEIRGR